MSLHPDLLDLCHGGPRAPWRASGQLARAPADRALPPVGWPWPGPGAASTFGNPPRKVDHVRLQRLLRPHRPGLGVRVRHPRQLRLRHRRADADHHGHPHAADPEGHTVDDGHAAVAAGDEEDPDAVQGRPAEAQRGAAEVLQGERHQPPGWMSSVVGADACIHRLVPGAAGTHPPGQLDGLRFRLGERPVGVGRRTHQASRHQPGSELRPGVPQPQLEDVPEPLRHQRHAGVGDGSLREREQGVAGRAVARHPLSAADRDRGGDRLHPAAPDPGSEPRTSRSTPSSR